MRYAFLNNFSQILAADLAAGATTLTLDGGGSLLSNASADLVYTLTLDDGEGTTEIVHVTGATGNDLTIERGKEGTTDAAWPTGSAVEMRLTAGAMDKMVQGPFWVPRFPYSSATAFDPLLWVYDGPDSYGSVDLGSGLDDWGGDTLGIGQSAILKSSSYYSGGVTLVGSNATSNGIQNTVFGAYAGTHPDDYTVAGVAVGYAPLLKEGADRSVILAPTGEITASDAVGIGNGTKCGVIGGLQINALAYVPSAYNHPAGNVSPDAVRQSCAQVVIATDPLDLTNNTAAVTLDLPAGTMFFIAAIDVVIVGSDTPGGTPEISVGPDDVTPAAYLAATPVGKSAVGGRETHSPLVSDGVTSLRVATSTAGTGTTYQAKIVFRGYVMEL